MMIKLADTVSDMTSDDYKERFRAEYTQLALRLSGLRSMLYKYENGTLTFAPECSIDLLKRQANVMTNYLAILEERAHKENIHL